MLSVGEETGAVARMLHKLAGFHDDELATGLKSLTSVIEPLMIGAGAIVGLRAGAVGDEGVRATGGIPRLRR